MAATPPSPASRHWLLLFAKYPYAGGAKTRLTPHLGREGATAFARAALTDTLRLYAREGNGCSNSHGLVWCYAADAGRPAAAARDDVHALLKAEGLDDVWHAWPQCDSPDLGARLAAAVERVQVESSTTSPCDDGEVRGASVSGSTTMTDSAPNGAQVATVTLIGADCVLLGPKDVVAASTHASRGIPYMYPALDGGYVLLALPLQHDLQPLHLFADIRWSCTDTGADQRQRIDKAFRQTSPTRLGPTLADVDEPADLAIFYKGEVADLIASNYPSTLAVVKLSTQK